jgi:nitrate/nitrite transporter NarK
MKERRHDDPAAGIPGLRSHPRGGVPESGEALDLVPGRPLLTFLSGVAAASGIALINSVSNLSGFAAPYITGWLADLTGQQRLGLWVVGATMITAAVITIVLRAAPRPDPAATG